eukprot:768417-Hanusia_phi.AAC.5
MRDGDFRERCLSDSLKCIQRSAIKSVRIWLRMEGTKHICSRFEAGETSNRALDNFSAFSLSEHVRLTR